MRVAKWRTVALLTLFYPAVAAAQTAGNWTQQSPQTSPAARSRHTLAYDSAHGQVVLFGGMDSSLDFLQDTWTWDGVNWAEKSPPTNPSALANGAMAYDSAHGQVILFGGNGDAAPFNDTWAWDGSTWNQQKPQTSPPARVFHSMAYDSAHGEVVLFGGSDANSNLLSDTWTWDGSNWAQQKSQTSPSAREFFAMAYDSAHGQVVLYGGSDANSNLLSDTWVWDGSNWTQKFPQTSPPARAEHAMVYDSVRGQVVLFGGAPIIGELNDTWVWDGSDWTLKFPQTSPPARADHAMAYDSAHEQVVLFGGRVSGVGSGDDTWTWNGGAIPPAGPTITDVISASAFGAFSAVSPGGWIEIYGSNLAPSTQGWTGADFSGNNAPTSLNHVSVMIGGQAAFVDYISPTQVDVQAPSNVDAGGTLQLTLNNGTATSAAVNVTVNTTEPGLLAPASFKVGANQYVVAQFLDGTYVLPTSAIAGINSRPAQPGELIIIYGVGFGAVTPDISAGQIVTEQNQLTASLEIMFGDTPAQLPYFGLAPNLVGVYQFNVVVPAVADSDVVPLTFNLGGVPGAQTLFTAVQQ